MNDEQSIRDELSVLSYEHPDGYRAHLHSKAIDTILPLLNRVRAEARAEGIRGAAEAVHAEARWQQEQVMRGAVQKSGAETAVERLLMVETLLRQQANYWEQKSEGKSE